MKKILLAVSVSAALVFASIAYLKTMPSASPLPVIHPLSHATMAITWGKQTVYTDPVGGAEIFKDQPAPNIILITDIHGDHLSTSTLSSITSAATIIAPQAVYDLLPPALAARTRVLKNDESLTEQSLTITAVPMYNLPETSDSRHARGRGNGYILERDDFRIYIAGDTAGTPEMRALKKIDIAFVPMNLPYTMSVDEAADAVLAFKPRQVYPYHYRQPDGLADVKRFKNVVESGDKKIEVILADWYPSTTNGSKK